MLTATTSTTATVMSPIQTMKHMSKPILKSYTMKLVLPSSSDVMELVIKLISQMLTIDEHMYIDAFNAKTNETSRPILVPNDIPKEEKYLSRYFIDVSRNRN
jgi:hypothetical protein